MSSEMGSTTILRSSNFAVRISHLGQERHAPLHSIPSSVRASSEMGGSRSSAVGPAQLCQLLLECAKAGFVLAVALGVRHQDSNAPHATWLLRACCELPSRETAEKSDELAPPHGAYPSQGSRTKYSRFEVSVRASQQKATPHVRLGPRRHGPMHVRFAPKADKQQIVSVCPLRAISGNSAI